MARLPNCEKAIIEQEKLTGYILSSTHPVGRFKATFFAEFGYSANNWKALESQLREFVLLHDVNRVEDMPYGRKYIINGLLPSPSGKTMQIITVWVILKDDRIPRFVTAYPGGLR